MRKGRVTQLADAGVLSSNDASRLAPSSCHRCSYCCGGRGLAGATQVAGAAVDADGTTASLGRVARSDRLDAFRELLLERSWIRFDEHSSLRGHAPAAIAERPDSPNRAPRHTRSRGAAAGTASYLVRERMN